MKNLKITMKANGKEKNFNNVNDYINFINNGKKTTEFTLWYKQECYSISENMFFDLGTDLILTIHSIINKNLEFGKNFFSFDFINNYSLLKYKIFIEFEINGLY